MSLDKTIRDRATQFGLDIATLVRQSIADEVMRLVGARSTPTTTAPKRATTAPTRKGRKLHLPPHCIAPNCKKPHRGLRFSLCCADHSSAPKSAKRKWLAAWHKQKASS